MGIALRHFDIACKANNIEVKYDNKNKKNKLGKSYYINVILK